MAVSCANCPMILRYNPAARPYLSCLFEMDLNCNYANSFCMQKETDVVYKWLTSERSHLKDNCKRKPPFDWSDIKEGWKDEAYKRIAQSGNPHTEWYWALAAPTNDCSNWIARWFLYHKFRYRDGRNRNPTKSSGSGKHHHSHGHGSSSKHHHKHRSDEHEEYYEEPSEYYPEESMTPGASSASLFFRGDWRGIISDMDSLSDHPSHTLLFSSTYTKCLKFCSNFLAAPVPQGYYAGGYAAGLAAPFSHG